MRISLLRTLAIRQLSSLIPTVACLATLLIAGCGSGDSGPDRYSVSGTVSRDGQPMSAGTIEFHSTTNVAGNAMAQIVDGKFSIGSDMGPTAGSYQVRISSITPQIAPTDPDEAMEAANAPPPKEEVAARFNSETELTAEVGPDKDNSFDFQVESSP
ncbi:hypothetical protein [Rubinisphaera sp. JC750]|uniref:hypothetical protein n=1 Tax=Rubinisphaera sp. JC750 TaxID=2898658 RepID=UPI001F1E0C50|nr:hypothetical protein [Rubinisphaera sp. JC750]